MSNHITEHKRLASDLCKTWFYREEDARNALVDFLQCIIRDLCGKYNTSDISEVFVHIIINACDPAPFPNTNLVAAVIFFLQNEKNEGGKSARDLLEDYADSINSGTATNHVNEEERVRKMLEQASISAQNKTPEKIAEEEKHKKNMSDVLGKLKKKKTRQISAKPQEQHEEQHQEQPKKNVAKDSYLHDLANNRVSFASRDEFKPEMAWVFEDHFRDVTFDHVADLLHYRHHAYQSCLHHLRGNVSVQELFRSAFDMTPRREAALAAEKERIKMFNDAALKRTTCLDGKNQTVQAVQATSQAVQAVQATSQAIQTIQAVQATSQAVQTVQAVQATSQAIEETQTVQAQTIEGTQTVQTVQATREEQ